MDRRIVLQSLITALAVEVTEPVWGATSQDKPVPQTKKEGLLVRFGENRNRAGFSPQHCLISGRDTVGALAINGPGSLPGHQPAVPSTPGGDPAAQSPGVPLHIHYAQDEFWYVFEGELLVQVGDQKFHAQPGDMVMGPRGVPHSFHVLKHPTVLLTLWQPAGTMEEFFHEAALAHQKVGGGRPDDAVMAAIYKAHGMEIVGPPVQP